MLMYCLFATLHDVLAVRSSVSSLVLVRVDSFFYKMVDATSVFRPFASFEFVEVVIDYFRAQASCRLVKRCSAVSIAPSPSRSW